MKVSPIILLFISSMSCAVAAEVIVPMNSVNQAGILKPIGNITITESEFGLIFIPSLSGLPSGVHGFHLHENPSCDPKNKEGKLVAALAAGGHYDPASAKQHGSPWGNGHLGDLPGLVVGNDGKSNYPVLAPRLKIGDIKSRTLILHSGGDNYSDEPAPLGGGGSRIACGIIMI